jgi:signal transduction histidine kinase
LDKDRAWPPALSSYLEKWIRDYHSPAFLFTDAKGRVISKGGLLSRYGLKDLEEGEPAVERAYFLEGLLPADRDRSILSRVETTAGVFADIHLFREGTGDCVLLLDVSGYVAERTQIEQALRQTEEQLRLADKMEALGRLAGGVAHDFNNLLTVILGYACMLEDAALSGKYQEALREIALAARRATEMTQGLLSFSRRQVRQIEVLDLNELISGLHQLLRRLIGEDVVLTVDLDPALGCVEANRGQIEQILVNLAANARDAMPMGGRLEIRTTSVMVDEAFHRANANSPLRPGPHVRLSVSDNGCGMDAETMARVFEPFFTSKPLGRGTGLGLSIVYGIIAQTGGDIKLSSEVGRGTRVDIFLPAAPKTVDPKPPEVEIPVISGTETILLVEDEERVRNLVGAILNGLGYVVLECSGPAEAIARCERYAGELHLLVTDLIMPQMDGSELAGRILSLRPGTRVLYVSGYAVESFARRGMNLPGNVLLEKPFTPALLAKRVREALDRRTAAGTRTDHREP